MEFIFERAINYYETDKMGVVHHSNYIKPYVKEYTGVRMTVGYEIIDKKTEKLVLIGETKHCFTDKTLKPINLKKHKKEFSDKFESLLMC